MRIKTPNRALRLALFVSTAAAAYCAAAQAPASPSSAASSARAAMPKIQFATVAHDFGRVKAGDPVRFDYTFTNTGGATLEVTDVHPSCGCTTVGSWSKEVAPAQTGHIPIQYNSAAGGGGVAKTITLKCNDPSQPALALQLTGTVWRLIDVSPRFAIINVVAGAVSNAPVTVRIVNNMEELVTLSQPEIDNPIFAGGLKIIRPGKEFELTLRVLRPLDSTNAQGQVTLKTSSTNTPEISLGVLASVQPVVAVAPTELVLPAAAGTNAVTYAVTVRNNGQGALKLSDPAVNNATGVHLQLREAEPGRFFLIMLTFPAGFQMAQGAKTELSVNSSNPKYPTLKVPIRRSLQ
jgi:hypothetical protein